MCADLVFFFYGSRAHRVLPVRTHSFPSRRSSDLQQLRAADELKQDLGRQYVVALNLASKTPAWLRAIGARPMNLGLDLRGGVHFLLEVDIEDRRSTRLNSSH